VNRTASQESDALPSGASILRSLRSQVYLPYCIDYNNRATTNIKRWLLGILMLFCEGAKKTVKIPAVRAPCFLVFDEARLLTFAASGVLLFAGRGEGTVII
jgi:hypothetical protein